MRALVIDGYAKAQVKRVLDHALDPKHYYMPHRDARVPGDDSRFVCHLNTYRAVFTITVDRGGNLWRHLSISVPSKDYPNPFAAYTIAEMFGFTGWDGKSANPPDGWVIRVDEGDHCIALGQEYRPIAGRDPADSTSGDGS